LDPRTISAELRPAINLFPRAGRPESTWSTRFWRYQASRSYPAIDTRSNPTLSVSVRRRIPVGAPSRNSSPSMHAATLTRAVTWGPIIRSAGRHASCPKQPATHGWTDQLCRVARSISHCFDAHEAPPYPDDLRQLSLRALCTNRDLPMLLPVARARPISPSRWVRQSTSIRCHRRSDYHEPSRAHGDIAWRMISHLSLNSPVYRGHSGAGAIRELLSPLYRSDDMTLAKQIEGIKALDRCSRSFGGFPVPARRPSHAGWRSPSCSTR